MNGDFTDFDRFNAWIQMRGVICAAVIGGAVDEADAARALGVSIGGLRVIVGAAVVAGAAVVHAIPKVGRDVVIDDALAMNREAAAMAASDGGRLN